MGRGLAVFQEEPVENYKFPGLKLPPTGCRYKTHEVDGTRRAPVVAMIDMRTQFMCLTKHPLGFMNRQCGSTVTCCYKKNIISSFEIQLSGACTVCL